MEYVIKEGTYPITNRLQPHNLIIIYQEASPPNTITLKIRLYAFWGNSLDIQRLGLQLGPQPIHCGGPGSIPGGGTEIPEALDHSQKECILEARKHSSIAEAIKGLQSVKKLVHCGVEGK